MAGSPIRVAINGYGRIGRCVLRALEESPRHRERIEIVAINELADLRNVTHLTKYDTTHGPFPGNVECEGEDLYINGRPVRVLHEPEVEGLPWAELGIDLVFECTGVLNSRQDAERHIASGAKKVLFSHPSHADVDATIVYGVNHRQLTPEHRIVSNASCTTNAIIPILDVLHRAYGVECAMITTLHSAMHDQPVIDAYDTDLRKTRSALQSIIPVNTGLAKGIERIMPQLSCRVHAQAIRVPTINVSMMDVTLTLETTCELDQLNATLKAAADNSHRGILGYSDELLVSWDYNHDRRSSIIDANQTSVCHTHMAKVVAWFDNEWGFSNRMLDTALEMIQ